MRLEFSYVVHGKPQKNTINGVWVRGEDTRYWQKMFDFNTDLLNIGKVQNSGSLSLYDALLSASQVYSRSTQVKFQQNDTSVIGLRNYGNGITIDDVKIYMVQNDLQLVSIISPLKTECGITGEVPLTIQLRNGVTTNLRNSWLSYQLDGGPVVSETLPLLRGKENLKFTFSRKIDLSKPGLHTLNVWVAANGDTYKKNDSILNYRLHNQPLIKYYPYLEDFEAGDGYWYSEGQNNSWEYGRPASPGINMAGSGIKAWKTDLDGNYNNLETSYLYSPCFDISALRQPVLKINTAMDIEDCGEILCDAAYMEYSKDGIEWERLGRAGEGGNWYNNANFQVWTVENRTNWQRSYTNIPPDSGTVRLRFVLNTDLGVTKQGIAVDDIEIFDYHQPPILLKLYPNPAVNGTFHLRWMATEGTDIQLSVTDVLGKEVYAISERAVVDTYNTTTVSLPHLPPGIYLLRCIIGDREYKEKIVFL